MLYAFLFSLYGYKCFGANRPVTFSHNTIIALNVRNKLASCLLKGSLIPFLVDVNATIRKIEIDRIREFLLQLLAHDTCRPDLLDISSPNLRNVFLNTGLFMLIFTFL